MQAFETEGLIGTGAAPAVLAYLFHRIEQKLDGRPTLLIVDEGRLVLDEFSFGAQLREWLKTLRKKNGSVRTAAMLHQEGKQARNQAPAHKQHPVAETQKATAAQEILEHRGYPKLDVTHCARSAG